MSIIKTENLTYIYGAGTPFEKAALKDVNIEIEDGEIIGLIGHTGSGKSTLIQHLNGLLKPSDGKVYIDGEDFSESKEKLKEVRFKVGLVFQYPEYQLFEDTVYKDIAFGPKNMKLDEAETDVRVRRAANLVGITGDQLEKSPFELSGGQKRRVAIAGVMAMEPEVLILDEPASGLDPGGREKIFGMIKRYHDEKRNTVLIVSHSMEDIARISDRILVMNEGGVFCFDTPENVFRRSGELEKIGLDAPQITRVFGRLRQRGIDLPDNVYSVKYAEKIIMEKLRT